MRCCAVPAPPALARADSLRSVRVGLAVHLRVSAQAAQHLGASHPDVRLPCFSQEKTQSGPRNPEMFPVSRRETGISSRVSCVSVSTLRSPAVGCKRTPSPVARDSEAWSADGLGAKAVIVWDKRRVKFAVNL